MPSFRVRKAADLLPSTTLTGHFSCCCFPRRIDQSGPFWSSSGSRQLGKIWLSYCSIGKLSATCCPAKRPAGSPRAGGPRRKEGRDGSETGRLALSDSMRPPPRRAPLPRIRRPPFVSNFGAKSLMSLVPVERIELPTFGLQNRCSTAELNRLTH